MNRQEWINSASCLDSAFERLAISQGLVNPKEAAFEENRNVPDFTITSKPSLPVHGLRARDET